MLPSTLLELRAAHLVAVSLLAAGCTCGSNTPGSSGSGSSGAKAERVDELGLEPGLEEELDSDTVVEWPTEPGPTVTPVPPPNLALAGGAQCTLSGPHLIGEHPRPDRFWRQGIEIGFGANGGLVAYTFGKTTAFLRPVDAMGAPRGDAASFVQDVEVSFSNLLALSNGFLLIGSNEAEHDHQLLWVTDPVGHRPQARTKLPLGTMGIIGMSDVVGDRLLFAGRDKWGVRVVLVQINADSTVDFPVYVEHLIVDVMQKAISADVALAHKHGVILFTESDIRAEDGRAYKYLFMDGEKRELAGEVPVPEILLHDHQTHRLAWHEGVLHILSGPEESESDSGPLIMMNPAGEKVLERGIDAKVAFRYGKMNHTWFEYGPSIEQPALTELEQPFSQRVVLEVGTARASRMTQLGLVGVGEPVGIEAIDPPIEDPTCAEWAWSGSHFVVAYTVIRADRVSVHTFALDCRK